MATSAWTPTRLLFWASLVSTLLATVVLAGAIRVGVNGIRNKWTADDVGPCRHCRYQPLPYITADRWNRAILGLGAVCGVVTFLALAVHEWYLRHADATAIARGKKLGALVRPATYAWHRRGFLWRWAALGVCIVAAQSSSIFALLSAGTRHGKLGAGLSHPLEALNETFLYAGPNTVIPEDPNTDPRSGDHLLTANPFIRYDELYPNDTLEIPPLMKKTAWYLESSYMPELESFMYQSSLAHLGRGVGPRRGLAVNYTGTGLQRGLRLGEALYPFLKTEGIGIDVSSYEQFAGDGMAGLPRNYTFKNLFGGVYSTNVSVSCSQIRGQYDIRDPEAAKPRAWNHTHMLISRRNGPETYDLRRDPNTSQVLSDFGFYQAPGIVGLQGSKQTKVSGPVQVPAQTVIIPLWDAALPNAVMLECAYLPSEYFKLFIVPGPNMPLGSKFGNVVAVPGKESIIVPPSTVDGRCLSPMLALPAARAIHELLSQDGQSTGGPLGKALHQLRVQMRAPYLFVEAIEEVLAETAQAYFSLLRQRVEKANTWPQNDQLRHPGMKPKYLEFDIVRLGGCARRPWLSFVALIFLALSAGAALLRTAVVGGLVSVSAKILYDEPSHGIILDVEKEGDSEKERRSGGS